MTLHQHTYDRRGAKAITQLRRVERQDIAKFKRYENQGSIEVPEDRGLIGFGGKLRTDAVKISWNQRVHGAQELTVREALSLLEDQEIS